MPTPKNDLVHALSMPWCGREQLRQYQTIAVVLLVFDTVFRSLAAIQLAGYATTIGLSASLLKWAVYGMGIVANVAIFKRQGWGVWLGFAAAAVGFWLVAMDAWSLLHVAFGPGLIAPGRFLLIRSTIKTLVRGIWLVIYVLALAVLLEGRAAPGGKRSS